MTSRLTRTQFDVLTSNIWKPLGLQAPLEWMADHREGQDVPLRVLALYLMDLGEKVRWVRVGDPPGASKDQKLSREMAALWIHPDRYVTGVYDGPRGVPLILSGTNRTPEQTEAFILDTMAELARCYECGRPGFIIEHLCHRCAEVEQKGLHVTDVASVHKLLSVQSRNLDGSARVVDVRPNYGRGPIHTTHEVAISVSTHTACEQLMKALGPYANTGADGRLEVKLSGSGIRAVLRRDTCVVLQEAEDWLEREAPDIGYARNRPLVDIECNRVLDPYTRMKHALLSIDKHRDDQRRKAQELSESVQRLAALGDRKQLPSLTSNNFDMVTEPIWGQLHYRVWSTAQHRVVDRPAQAPYALVSRAENGKTTLLQVLALHLMQQGLKIRMVGGEDATNTFYRWAKHLHLEDKYHEGESPTLDSEPACALTIKDIPRTSAGTLVYVDEVIQRVTTYQNFMKDDEESVQTHDESATSDQSRMVGLRTPLSGDDAHPRLTFDDHHEGRKPLIADDEQLRRDWADREMRPAINSMIQAQAAADLYNGIPPNDTFNIYDEEESPEISHRKDCTCTPCDRIRGGLTLWEATDDAKPVSASGITDKHLADFKRHWYAAQEEAKDNVWRTPIIAGDDKDDEDVLPEIGHKEGCVCNVFAKAHLKTCPGPLVLAPIVSEQGLAITPEFYTHIMDHASQHEKDQVAKLLLPASLFGPRPGAENYSHSLYNKDWIEGTRSGGLFMGVDPARPSDDRVDALAFGLAAVKDQFNKHTHPTTTPEGGPVAPMSKMPLETMKKISYETTKAFTDNVRNARFKPQTQPLLVSESLYRDMLKVYARDAPPAVPDVGKIMNEMAPGVMRKAGLDPLHPEYSELWRLGNIEFDRQNQERTKYLLALQERERCECGAQGKVGRSMGWGCSDWCPTKTKA